MKFKEPLSQPETALIYEVLLVGEDVLVLVTGPSPHLGGVSFAQPYKKEGRKTVSATVSSLGRFEHQDHELTAFCAKHLSKELERAIVVVGGLHIDHLSKGDLDAIWVAAERLNKRVIKEIRSRQ